jgi:F-type H+-transporting ATPase subunit gamma
MAGLRDIKRRLTSVKNTKKITYAMKLVSAAKLKRAQDAVTRSRDYTKSLKRLVSELTVELGAQEFSHPLCQERAQVKNVALIVVGGGRGLCGGFNTNVNRKIESFIRELKKEHPQAALKNFVIGKKPAEYFRRTNRSMELSLEALSEDPTKWPLDDVLQKVEQQFLAGEVDKVYVMYTQFRSALNMSVEVETLLPMAASADDATEASVAGKHSFPGQAIIEPNLESVFMAALSRVFRVRLLQASLDSKASEHASRMTAMDAATKNAGDLIKRLQLTYNKLRQAGITGELLDIIGGAEAIN